MRSTTETCLWRGILLLFLWTFATGQQSCPVGTSRPNLQPQNGSQSQLSINSGFMSPIVHSFLGLVQPNPFPKDLLLKMMNFNSITQEVIIKEVLTYQKGFLVCVAIGILYIVLMPLIGLIFACCRCCGNCGGRMQQKQTSSIHCKRRSIYFCTFITTVLILAGNVCMFLSSSYTSETVLRGPSEISGILENVKGYIGAIPTQIQQVTNESIVTVNKVKNNLNATGPVLGGMIQNGLKGSLDPAFNSISAISQVISSTSAGLLQVNKTMAQLKPKVDLLQANLSAVRQRINNTLQMPECANCTSLLPELDKLSMDGGLEGRDFFERIPEMVENNTKMSVGSALVQLDQIKNQIAGVSGKLPLGALTSVTTKISDVQRIVSSFSPEMEKASLISRAVGFTLSSFILLVVVCNVLGLVLGPSGLDPKDSPSDRSGMSNCGGVFFMVGVGFSFLISWIFMLVVLILFIGGGNTYTMVCVPWHSKQLFQIIDTPGLIPGFNISTTLNLNTNVNIDSIYSDCQHDKALWTTLHLNELFNLNDFLNISKYTANIYQYFEEAQISLTNITILSPEIKSQLYNFSGSASTMNFNDSIQQINNVSKINLNPVAESLDILAAKQVNQNVSSQLHAEAQDLRGVQSDITSNIMPLLLELNATINNLRTLSSQISGAVADVINKANSAQNTLNYDISQIVKSESRVFIDCQFKIFMDYATWANQTIIERVGRCGAVAAAVDRSEQLLCKHFVGSLNAFWFSLGWCMLFLIPSIIFSVKLAKYYRRMKYCDVYE
ncbi:hypothetical protein DNTS_026934 [Danionella cerebrum]|nr:hypothetical protein DNTS_026934 [Danionella translucida]TRY85028.1 hypothetical protein DNTS_026934 [Danionella translucida]